jgi:hypothetical protein
MTVRLDADVHIGVLETNLLSRLSLGDVRVGAGAGVLGVDTVTVHYELAALLRRRVHLTHVRIGELLVAPREIVVPDGSSGGGRRLELRIDYLSLDGLTIKNGQTTTSLGPAALRGEISSGGVHVEELTVEAWGLAIGGSLDYRGEYLEGRIQAAGQPEVLRSWLGSFVMLEPQAELTAEIVLTGSPGRASATVLGSYSGVEVDGTVRIVDLREISGQSVVTGLRPDLGVSREAIRVPVIEEARGGIEFSVDLRDGLEAGEAYGWLEATGISVSSYPLPDHRVEVSYRAGFLEGTIRGGEDRITLNGRTRPTLEGEFSGSVRDVGLYAAFLGAPGLRGAAEIRGEVEDGAGGPRVRVEFSAGPLRYDWFPVESVTGAASWSADEGLLLEELRGAGTLLAEEIPGARAAGVSGRAHYSFVVGGRPRRIEGSGRAILVSPGVGSVSFRSGRMAAALKSGEILIESLSLNRPDLTVWGQGGWEPRARKGHARLVFSSSAGPAGEASVLLAAAPFRLYGKVSEVELLLVRAFQESLPDIDGRLSGRFAVEGGVAAVDLQVSQPAIAGVLFERGSAAVRISRRSLEIVHLAFDGVDSRVSLHGGVRLDSSGRPEAVLEGEVSVEELDIKVLEPLIPLDPVPEGRLSILLRWPAGTRFSPRGAVHVSDGAVFLPGRPPVDRISIDAMVEPRDSALVAGAPAWLGYRTTLSLQARLAGADLRVIGQTLGSGVARHEMDVSFGFGRLGVHRLSGVIAPDFLDLTAELNDVAVAVLKPYLPQFAELSGTMRGQIRVSGRPADPRMNGSVVARGIVVRHSSLDTTFSDGRVRVTVDNNRVRVEEAWFAAGRGSVRASGEVTIAREGFGDMDFGLRAGNVVFARKNFFELGVESARARLERVQGRISLSGEAQLGRSELVQDFDPTALSMMSRQMSQNRDEGDPASDIAVNLRVRGGDRLWVNTNIARLRLGADLDVGGTVGQPLIRGRVRTEEGHVVFLDRRFEVSSGSLTFSDSTNAAVRLNARSDVTATGGSGESYAILLAVSGTVENPIVRLSSNPALSEGDIYSLLLLGTPGSGIAGGAGGAVANRAGELATERLSSYVSRNLNGVLGLEELSVQGNAFDVGRAWNPRVRATTRIFEWLRITYETDARSFEQDDVEVDVRLSRNLSLEGRMDEDGNTSMNLQLGVVLP